MNQLFEAAAESARYGWVMGIMTLVFIAFFIGWAWWAYSPGNREKMERAARMPLSPEDSGE